MSGATFVLITCVFGLTFSINVWCKEISKERLKSKSLNDAHIDISSFIKVSKNGTDGKKMNALFKVVGHVENPINDTEKHFFRPVESKTMNKTVKTATKKTSKNSGISKNTAGSTVDASVSIAGHMDKLIVNNSAKHFFVPVKSNNTSNKSHDINAVLTKTIEKTVVIQKKLIDILPKSKLNFHQMFHLFNLTVNDLLLINRMARHGAKLILKHANSDRLNYTTVSSQVGTLTAKVLAELYNRSYQSTKMALYEILSQVSYSWSPWSVCSVTCGPNGFKQRLLKVQIGKRVLYTDVHQAVCSNSKSCPVRLTAWGEWSACNSLCSPSYSVRKRYCLSGDCSSSKFQNTQKKRCLKPPCSLLRRKPTKSHRPHKLHRPHNLQGKQNIQQPNKPFKPQKFKQPYTSRRPYKTYRPKNLQPSKAYRPNNLQRQYRIQRPYSVRRLHRIQRPYNVHQPQRIQRPYNVHQPQRIQRPYNVHQPQRIQRPYNVHQPQRIQRPYNVHQPQRIHRPYNVHKPQRIQRPYNVRQSQRIHEPYGINTPYRIHQSQRIHQPYRTHGPYKIQQPYGIHRPYRIKWPYNRLPVRPKPVKSTTVATTTTTTTQMTTTTERVIKGYWSPWSKWSACSATCGLGLEIRRRECVSHKRFRNEKVVCVQDLYKQTRTCILSACNRDSVVSEVKRVIQGTDTTLHCGIPGRHGPRNVYWITPKGKKITRHTKSQRYRIHHSKLTISETQVNDRGEYHCVAVDGNYHEVTADAMIYVATCRSRICKNGALCVEDIVSLGHRHTTCHCKHGYYGRLCEKKDNTDTLYIVTGVCSAVFVILTFALFVHWLWKKRDENNKTVTKLDAVTFVPKTDAEQVKDKTLPKTDTEKGPDKTLSRTGKEKDKDKTSKKLNTSVVSNDKSLVEIEEKDYKKFSNQKLNKEKNSKTTVSEQKLNKEKNSKTSVKSDQKLNKDRKESVSATKKESNTTKSKEKLDKHSKSDVKILKSSSKIKSKTNNDVYETVHKTPSSQLSKGVSFEDELCIDFTDIYKNMSTGFHQTTSRQPSVSLGQALNNTRSTKQSSANHNQLPEQHVAKASSASLSSNFCDTFSNLKIMHLTSKRRSTNNFEDMSAQEFSKSYVPLSTEPDDIYNPLLQNLSRQPTDICINVSDQGVETENLLRKPTDIYLDVSDHGVEAHTRQPTDTYSNVSDQRVETESLPRKPTDIYVNISDQGVETESVHRKPTDICVNISDQGVETESLHRQPTDIHVNVSQQGVDTDTLSITHHTTTESSYHQLSGRGSQGEPEKFYEDGNYENQTEKLDHFYTYGNGFSHDGFMYDQQQDTGVMEPQNEFSNPANYDDYQMYEEPVTTKPMTNGDHFHMTSEQSYYNATPYIDNAEATTQQTQDHSNFDGIEASSHQSMIDNGSEITYPNSSCPSCPSTLVDDLVNQVIDGEAQKLMMMTSDAVYSGQHFYQDQSSLGDDLNIVHKTTCNPETLSNQNENFKLEQDKDRSEVSTTDLKGEMSDCPTDVHGTNQSGIASDNQDVLENPSSVQVSDSKDQQMNDTDLSAYNDCTSTVDTTLNSTAGYRSCGGETPDVVSQIKGENWITVRPSNELDNTQGSDSLLQHQDWDVYIDDELYGKEELQKTKDKEQDDTKQTSGFSFTQEKENIFGEDDFLDELDDEWED